MNDIKIAVRPECLNLPFVASSQLQSFIQRFFAHGSRCRRLAGEIRRAIFERNSRSAAGIRGHAIVRMDRVVAGGRAMGLVAHRFAGAAISYEHVRQGWRSCHLFSVLLLIAFLTASHPAASQTPVQINQNFNSQGPGPRSGPIYAVQTADAPPNGTEAGAVQSVLPDFALGPNTYFAGAPNGGVWITNNGGTLVDAAH